MGYLTKPCGLEELSLVLSEILETEKKGTQP